MLTGSHSPGPVHRSALPSGTPIPLPTGDPVAPRIQPPTAQVATERQQFRLIRQCIDRERAGFQARLSAGSSPIGSGVAWPLEGALELAPRPRFDVLVTDLQMPCMDGLEFAAALRESDPALPVLLVTAHATVDAAVRVVRGSMTDFLTKPLKADVVCTAIDAAARTPRLRQPRA